jgi:hypothetical protein
MEAFKSSVSAGWASSVLQALGLASPPVWAAGDALAGRPSLVGAASGGSVGLLDAGAQALQELVWLQDLAQRRRPFDAVVHCLCAPLD